MIGPYPEPGAQVAGGVERVIDTLLPELARHVDLTLVVPGALADAEHRNNGVRTIYLKRGPGPGAARYWTFDAHRAAEAVRRLRPDIVHLQGVAGVGRLLDQPKILTVHGIVDRDLLIAGRGRLWGRLVRHGVARLMRGVEHRERKRIGNVIVINPYVFEAMPDIAALRTFRIPNPVDPAFFASPCVPETPKRKRVLSIGQIGPLKNTLTILETVARLMKEDETLTLTICGKAVDAAYHRRCLDFVRSRGLDERIFLPGNLSADKVRKLLDRSTCLVMASRQENAPMAIAEAHARGIPVVAPESFGIKHMIVPGKSGLFLPDRNTEEQAAVLRQALRHDWDRTAIAEEARRLYDPVAIAEKTLSAYREVIARASGSLRTTSPEHGMIASNPCAPDSMRIGPGH